MKILLIFLFHSSLTKITQLEKTNPLLTKLDIPFLSTEFFGVPRAERHLSVDEIQKEISEDQTHKDVYDGMYGGLGKSPLDFGKDVKTLRHEIQ